jgi:hypothetical protein
MVTNIIEIPKKIANHTKKIWHFYSWSCSDNNTIPSDIFDIDITSCKDEEIPEKSASCPYPSPYKHPCPKFKRKIKSVNANANANATDAAIRVVGFTVKK